MHGKSFGVQNAVSFTYIVQHQISSYFSWKNFNKIMKILIYNVWISTQKENIIQPSVKNNQMLHKSNCIWIITNIANLNCLNWIQMTFERA